MEDYNINLFIENVKHLARKNKIQLGELEEEVGVSRGYLSRILKDNSRIRLDVVINLANYFQMYIDDIFFYDKTEDELNEMIEEEQKLVEALDDLRERIKDFKK